MYSLKEIIKHLNVIEFRGNSDVEVYQISKIDKVELGFQDIVWISEKNSDKISNLKSTNVICNSNTSDAINTSCNILIVDNPRYAFKKILEMFSEKVVLSDFISPSAFVDSSAYLESPVYIGHNCIIEEGCKILKNSKVGNNNVILKNTIIGENVIIGHNNTIGGVGFGYEKNSLGEYEFIPHIGGVIIEGGVEIGNNTCIDRAVIGNTVIGKNVKIDNLVHIAHGVSIGENSLIIANTMIAGSCIIGENVWVSPSSSILNKVIVNDNSIVGLGSVVIKNVDKDCTVAGNPARYLEKK